MCNNPSTLRRGTQPKRSFYTREMSLNNSKCNKSFAIENEVGG